jgi:Trk-type K+ transport system membrane component
VFRPATQRWLNRGDQQLKPVPSRIGRLREQMASYVMVIWMTAMLLAMALYIGILRRPTWETVWQAVHPG